MLIPELALCRLVELSSGSIVIDGVDASTIGLTDLRTGLVIIPQEPVSILFHNCCPVLSDALFFPASFYVSYLHLSQKRPTTHTSLSSVYAIVSGTLRSNLDPLDLYDDATLWGALKRSYLVEPSKHDSLISTSEHETPSAGYTRVNRFTLDMVIEDEGANLSVGQVSSF